METTEDRQAKAPEEASQSSSLNQFTSSRAMGSPLKTRHKSPESQMKNVNWFISYSVLTTTQPFCGLLCMDDVLIVLPLTCGQPVGQGTNVKRTAVCRVANPVRCVHKETNNR